MDNQNNGGWRQIADAEKGTTRIVSVGDKGATREIFMPNVLLVGRADGQIVTQSSWNDKHQRWSMFTKDAPPTHFWDFGNGATMPPPPKG